MPPRAKFTKEEIAETALRIVEREGLAALTARSLGAALGSSARPIFTVFDSMDDVLYAVNSRAKEIYGKYIEEGLREAVAFRGVGRAYIRFAAERPNNTKRSQKATDRAITSRWLPKGLERWLSR